MTPKHLRKAARRRARATSRVLGVVPSRWGSTRFPGKSLALIGGKPLIQWVLERARQAERLDTLLVATDDERIRAAVVQLGFEAVMTRADHPSGTDRAAEAIRGREGGFVVNIQGDEPLIDPSLIDRVAAALTSGEGWDMVTAAAPLGRESEVRDPAVVKVVWDEEGRALYFSRSVIPFEREKDAGPRDPEPLYWRHIGLYGYRRDFLERLVATPPCAAERAERLEQLRALHIGGRIRVIRTEDVGPGVDMPADVERAERALREAGLI